MDALERKVRSIYDALDAKNPKAAAKLATAALQKYKDNQQLRVLKALAFLCLDRASEAFDICEEVRGETPCDEHVLSLLAMVYKPLGHRNKMTAAYEAASKSQPQDLRLLYGLFCAYVREGDLVRQQQVAMRLHRQDKSGAKPLWWIVTSLVLQARCAGSQEKGGMASEKLLQLAESMAAKQLAAGGHSEGYEPVMLYLHILQEQGKAKEALDMIRGPLGDAIALPEERRLLTASLTANAGDSEKAAALYWEAAVSSPDAWAALQGYLDCKISRGILLANGNGHPRQACAQTGANGEQLTLDLAQGSSTQEAEQHLKQLLASSADKETATSAIRWPLLAAVDLEARRVELGERDAEAALEERLRSQDTAGTSGRSGSTEPDTQHLADAALAYFQCFGHTASCAMDLRTYTGRVGGRSRQWLAQEIHQCCQGSGPALEARIGTLGIGQIQQLVSAFQVEHDLGLPEFAVPAAADAHAARLLRVYRQAAKLEAALDEKERGTADALVALAAGALVAAWRLEAAPRQPQRLLRALLVLEAAQQRRRVSAPLRLAATGLYSLLGAPLAAAESFAGLDIKHIQHDTLSGTHAAPLLPTIPSPFSLCSVHVALDIKQSSGHWLLPALLGGARREQGAEALGECRRLYEDAQRDWGDSAVTAMQAGTYTKVLEFARFRERLLRSRARMAAYTELAALALASFSAGTPPADVARAATTADAQLRSAVQPAMELHAERRDRYIRALVKQHDGGNTQPLRFNDDLATRPAWLPPEHCRPGLALAAWWAAQDAAPGPQHTPGFGRCWWSRVLAAEQGGLQPRAFRTASLRSLLARRDLPSLLAHALSPNSAAAAAALPPLLENLAALPGVQSRNGGDSFEQGLPEALNAAASSRTAHLPTICQLLHLATFTAAASVQACLVNPAAAAASSGFDDAHACVANAQKAAETLSSLLTAALLACKGPVLTGGALFLAAAVANEEAYWLALCLQAWTALIKKRRKSKKAAAAADETAVAGLEGLRLQLVLTGQALETALQGLSTAVKDRASACNGRQDANELERWLEAPEVESTVGAAELWEWEPQLHAVAIVLRVQNEQCKTMESLVGSLARVLGVLQNVQ